jgi:uncharacterized small protein (DUF1192 family)
MFGYEDELKEKIDRLQKEIKRLRKKLKAKMGANQ